MEPFRVVGKRREITTILVSTQWTRKPVRGRDPEKRASKAPLRTINVIFVVLGRTSSQLARVMSVVGSQAEDSHLESKRARLEIQPVLSFSDKDKVGTIQPHDDALVITLRIGGYDVRRVMVDEGSNVEIMYPDMNKGLNLKLEDLIAYESPLISFDGKLVIPKGQVRLPMQARLEVVEVDFIVVDAYSFYIAIVARPWLHALGTISSTLH